MLSGKELFNYNSSLFVDDDGAIDESEEQAMNADMLKRKELEEAKAREEAERIQAEQERLAELQRIEFEVRQRKEADRRLYAAAPNRATFVLAGVTINQVVFEDDEEEDLTPFPEETLVEAEVLEEGHYANEGVSEELKEAYLQGSDDENDEGEEEDGEDGEGSDEEDGESDGEEGKEGKDSEHTAIILDNSFLAASICSGVPRIRTKRVVTPAIRVLRQPANLCATKERERGERGERSSTFQIFVFLDANIASRFIF
ncbi:MAG: hypothetical protein GY721_12200 [Deltaproteobacteria bacterium]|nr:hypothetical protein [Deltaproteobacteria bacterium]